MPSGNRKRFVAFEVFVNDVRQCLAGARNHSVLAAHLVWPGAPSLESTACALEVGGLSTRSSKHTYTTWIERFDLEPGDEVRIRVVNTTRATRPTRRKTEIVLSERESRRRRFQELKAEFEPQSAKSKRRLSQR